MVTDEQIAAACDVIANRGSVREAAENVGVSFSSLWRALTSSQYAGSYTRAREQRAVIDDEEIERISAAVEAEQIKPDAARVIIGARQWLAERRDGRRYGTKQQIEHTGSVSLEQLVVKSALRKPEPDSD